jgi:hypothetical protein
MHSARTTDLGTRVLLPELIDATAGVHDLLLAREERVAARAHFDLQVMAQGRARRERAAAAARNSDLLVIGMNSSFHDDGSAGKNGREV